MSIRPHIAARELDAGEVRARVARRDRENLRRRTARGDRAGTRVRRGRCRRPAPRQRRRTRARHRRRRLPTRPCTPTRELGRARTLHLAPSRAKRVRRSARGELLLQRSVRSPGTASGFPARHDLDERERARPGKMFFRRGTAAVTRAAPQRRECVRSSAPAVRAAASAGVRAVRHAGAFFYERWRIFCAARLVVRQRGVRRHPVRHTRAFAHGHARLRCSGADRVPPPRWTTRLAMYIYSPCSPNRGIVARRARGCRYASQRSPQLVGCAVSRLTTPGRKTRDALAVDIRRGRRHAGTRNCRRGASAARCSPYWPSRSAAQHYRRALSQADAAPGIHPLLSKNLSTGQIHAGLGEWSSAEEHSGTLCSARSLVATRPPCHAYIALATLRRLRRSAADAQGVGAWPSRARPPAPMGAARVGADARLQGGGGGAHARGRALVRRRERARRRRRRTTTSACPARSAMTGRVAYFLQAVDSSDNTTALPRRPRTRSEPLGAGGGVTVHPDFVGHARRRRHAPGQQDRSSSASPPRRAALLRSAAGGPALLAHADAAAVVPALPVMVLAFTYHNVVPTVTTASGYDLAGRPDRRHRPCRSSSSCCGMASSSARCPSTPPPPPRPSPTARPSTRSPRSAPKAAPSAAPSRSFRSSRSCPRPSASFLDSSTSTQISSPSR